MSETVTHFSKCIIDRRLTLAQRNDLHAFWNPLLKEIPSGIRPRELRVSPGLQTRGSCVFIKPMGWMKNLLMGGAIGAYYKGNRTSQQWDSDENRARMHTMFPGDHAQQSIGFWGAKVKNEQDKRHKEVMRGVRMKEARFT